MSAVTKYYTFNVFFKKFLSDLLGWHWLIKLYRFQVHCSMIHHLYIISCVHQPKSSLLLSPFIPPLPSSPAPTPFTSDNHHTVVCVCEGFFCLILSSFLYSSPLHTTPFWELSVCSLCLSVYFYFVCLFCSLDSTHKWNHMVFVFFWLAYFT